MLKCNKRVKYPKGIAGLALTLNPSKQRLKTTIDMEQYDD